MSTDDGSAGCVPPKKKVPRTLSDHEQLIREYVNMPRRHYDLNQDPNKLNKLTSALDVIGDAEVAIESYLHDKWPEGVGPAYIQVYGILQMLFVLQDAAQTVCESLKAKYPRENPDLNKIRELRNASIGHPTDLHGKNKNFAGFISRATLSRDGFDLGLISSKGLSSSSFIKVDIQSLISTQHSILAPVLDEAYNRLREDEMNHRARFTGKKVEDVFHPSLGYLFQKMYEAITSNEAIPMGMVHTNMIREIANSFRQALLDRGEWEHTRSIKEEFSSWIEYPLDELAKYFADKTSAYLDDRSAYVFVDFLERSFENLKKIAREIDSTYQSAPP
ncbi:MAG: hypothetical protein ACREPG_02970 [Candidatus Binatia bacterium]